MRLSTVTGDQQYIKASAKYFAISLAGGGGPVGVGRLDRPGRFDSSISQIIEGHTGSVLDMDFSPFDDSMLATASEDCSIKIWGIPEDWEPTDAKGNAKKGTNMTESLTDLMGHKKKVTLLRFHPTASNVLASASADYSVKVWDVEKGETISNYADMGDLIHDIVWDTRGDVLATSSKGKLVHFFDPRQGVVADTLKSPHDGVKSTKLAYLGDTGKFMTCGSTKQSTREVKIWDLKNLSKPLVTEKIDTASGAMLPLFDSDTNVLYLAGKGDGLLRLYEYDDNETALHKLNEGFRSTVPAKGLCVVPKRGLDVMKCETARILKLTNTQGVHPLTFTVPRKSDAFQDDIFPDCASSTPAHTAEQWAAGSSKAPVKMSLNPATEKANGGAKKKTFKTVSTLTKELAAADKRIKYLEQKLKDNNIKCD